jgi:hypothetical protein
MSTFDLERYIASGAAVDQLSPALEQARFATADTERALAELDRRNVAAIRALAGGEQAAQEAHENNLPFLYEVRNSRAPQYIAGLRQLADSLEAALPVLDSVLDGWQPTTVSAPDEAQPNDEDES